MQKIGFVPSEGPLQAGKESYQIYTRIGFVVFCYFFATKFGCQATAIAQ